MTDFSKVVSDPVLAILLTQLLLVWSLVTSQFEWSRSRHAKLLTLGVAIPLAALQIYVGVCLTWGDASRDLKVTNSLADISRKAEMLTSTEMSMDRELVQVRSRISTASSDLSELDNSLRDLNAAVRVQQVQLENANNGIGDLAAKQDAAREAEEARAAAEADRERARQQAEEDRVRKEHKREECLARYKSFGMEQTTALFFCDN